MNRKSKRDKLIETAIKLFSEFGFHATSVDRIVEEAGISKKTVYKHFRTKNDLVLAALRRFDENARSEFVRAVESNKNSAREQLLAIFDVAEKWFSQKNFYGCIFIHANGEFDGRVKPIKEICKQYKRMIRDFMAELATKANASDPEELADQLALLYEGATVTAYVSDDDKAAMRAQTIAKILIDNACPVLANEQ